MASSFLSFVNILVYLYCHHSNNLVRPDWQHMKERLEHVELLHHCYSWDFWWLYCPLNLFVLCDRYIQSTCATSGEGLYEGLDWLSSNIASKVRISVLRSFSFERVVLLHLFESASMEFF